MIGIVNYGSGNVKAIANIYKRLNIEYFITNEPNKLKQATHLVLPGVGAFDQTMNLLNNSGLRAELDDLVLVKRVPIIGICVGMQIMAESSEEGVEPGLSWFKGQVKKIEPTSIERKPKTPHMGWNSLVDSTNSMILKNIDNAKGFYFLHSFYVQPNDPENTIAKVDYGSTLPCAIHRDNIYGVQFHPEKSHSNGVQIFQNFASL